MSNHDDVDPAALQTVRWLTLREIAEMWAPEARIPVSVMLRELRLAVINIPRINRGEEKLDVPPPDDELPDPDERVDRAWLIEFCDKQEGWREPSFWFGKVEPELGYPGRPSLKRAIVQELERRAIAGKLEEGLMEQARQLSEWSERHFPGKHTPTAKTVANQIRDNFRRLKAEGGTA